MPYISDSAKTRVADQGPRTPGELNYAISCVIRGYMASEGMSYAHLADCLGALEGAKLEFYRRMVVPYEEARKLDNGDVYPSWGV